MTDDRHVVRDEEERQPELAPKVADQVEDLRLHGDVERETGSSATTTSGSSRGPAPPDPLTLAAGELVRESVGMSRIEANDRSTSRDPEAPLVGRADPMSTERLADDRADAAPRVQGRVRSWKTIWISRRSGRSGRRDQLVMSGRRGAIRPAVGSSSRVTSLATVDLPQPVSPTSPEDLPSAMSKETPSTACTTAPRWRWTPVAGKCLTRPVRAEERSGWRGAHEAAAAG